MSELRKANTDHSYFLTFTIAGWIDVFTRQKYCDKIIESLQFCIDNKGLDIFAYVIMSSHIHLVARSLDSQLGDIIRDFKSFTAREILKIMEFEPGESRKEWMLHMFKYYAKYKKQNKKYLFWQKTSYPIELSYPEIVDEKIDYIHMNPVAAGYVALPEMWWYSSANPQSPLTVMQSFPQSPVARFHRVTVV